MATALLCSLCIYLLHGPFLPAELVPSTSNYFDFDVAIPVKYSLKISECCMNIAGEKDVYMCHLNKITNTFKEVNGA